MQRNFILMDVMKTGNHQDLEGFISMHSLENQQFDVTGEYYTLHNHDLDSYDRRFAIIDVRSENCRIANNKEFCEELTRRCDLLSSQGFVFIKATPWESLENIQSTPQYPEIELEHVKWTGGVSWFWYYMYTKHQDKTFNFDHSNKKYDFLYLNKQVRAHRKKLYGNLLDNGILENSLHTRWPLTSSKVSQLMTAPISSPFICFAV